MNLVWLFSLSSLILCFTVKCQASREVLAFHDPTIALKPSAEERLSMAVQVEAQHLSNVSNSVLMAESWLRSHVLAHYPSTNITAIVVGRGILCSRGQQHNFGLVLPSVKNLHHSLTRWGLQNDIKVTASFSSDCVDLLSETYRADVAERYIKPLLAFLQEIGSPYVVNPLSDESEPASVLLKSHSKSMDDLGVPRMKTMSLILNSRRERKLSFTDISNTKLPFPPLPTPAAPSHSPSHSSTPAYAVGAPLPPLVGTISPTPTSLPVAPSLPPETNPKPPPYHPHLAPTPHPNTPPYGPHLPPCEPSHGGSEPVAPVHHGLWCVAKPSVPAETLQEALDYACAEGNADCEAIQHDESCYFPNTVVAHASYAFNSYWQKTKRNGGTCGFGGTAMLINSDPSYGHCRFILS